MIRRGLLFNECFSHQAVCDSIRANIEDPRRRHRRRRCRRRRRVGSARDNRYAVNEKTVVKQTHVVDCVSHV